MASVKELIDQLCADPAKAQELTDEELQQLMREINPYGNIIAAKKTYANLSLINWRDEYLKRFHITALVGYLYRLQFEYKPKEVDSIEIKYEKAIQAATTTEEKTALRSKRDAEIKTYCDTCKEVVKRFLDKNFEYDPDRHVRVAPANPKDDPERPDKDQLIKETCKVASRAQGIEKRMKKDSEKTYKYAREQTLRTYQIVSQAQQVLKSVTNSIRNGELDVEDKTTILEKCADKLANITKDMNRVVEPLMAAETSHTLTVTPPADVFYHYNRYVTNHYEQLRRVCSALYAEKPDMEYGIIFYDSFDTEEEARQHRIKHDADFRAAAITIENNGVTLLGPFKENRDRVDFYNKNTEILKRMMEQMELDHKLGKDLMEKGVKKQKAKDIAKYGLDSEGLSKYSDICNELRDIGAKKVLSRDDQLKLEELSRTKEQLEVPEDYIAMDVFKPIVDETGEMTLVRNVIHTQSEDPLHLEENSPYVDKYQPKRAPGEKTQYKTKTIVDKTGNKKTFRVLKGDEST